MSSWSDTVRTFEHYVNDLVLERMFYRLKNKFARADDIRMQLELHDIVLLDCKNSDGYETFWRVKDSNLRGSVKITKRIASTARLEGVTLCPSCSE